MICLLQFDDRTCVYALYINVKTNVLKILTIGIDMDFTDGDQANNEEPNTTFKASAMF